MQIPCTDIASRLMESVNSQYEEDNGGKHTKTRDAVACVRDDLPKALAPMKLMMFGCERRVNMLISLTMDEAVDVSGSLIT